MKKLYRKTSAKIIGGVCAGVAAFFEVDPTVVRLIWAVVSLFYGIGVLAYIIAWILVPDENAVAEE